MSKSFLYQFCQRLITTYVSHAPGLLRSSSFELDLTYRWLSMRFGIADSRGVDEIYVRLLNNGELCVDLAPGANQLPQCLMDRQGLRWIALYDKEGIRVSTSAEKVLSGNNKRDVEILVTAFYDTVQESSAMLRFVLSSGGIQFSCEEEFSEWS